MYQVINNAFNACLQKNGLSTCRKRYII